MNTPNPVALQLVTAARRDLLASMNVLEITLNDYLEEFERWNDDAPYFPHINDERIFRLVGEVLKASKKYDTRVAVVVATCNQQTNPTTPCEP